MAEARANQYEIIRNEGALRVARVYAEALLQAADKRGEAEQVLDELEGLMDAIAQGDAGLEAFLGSPEIPRERREEIIKSAFEGKASETFVNFLLVLNKHDRLDHLRAVTRSYRLAYDRRFGRLPVQVASAAPLAEDQVERLRQELRAAFKGEPVLDLRVDPELLGGLVLRVKDWLYDASLRTRIETVRDQLFERSNHEIQSGRDRFSSGS